MDGSSWRAAVRGCIRRRRHPRRPATARGSAQHWRGGGRRLRERPPPSHRIGEPGCARARARHLIVASRDPAGAAALDAVPTPDRRVGRLQPRAVELSLADEARPRVSRDAPTPPPTGSSSVHARLRRCSSSRMVAYVASLPTGSRRAVGDERLTSAATRIGARGKCTAETPGQLVRLVPRR